MTFQMTNTCCFLLKKKKKKSSEKYGSTQPNPQPNLLDPSSTRPTRLPRLLKHFVPNLNESKLFMYKIKENVIEQRKIS